MVWNALEKLPPEAQREAMDFIALLAQKYGKKTKSQTLSYDWAGGLADFAGEYDSVTLQHKAAEWR